MPQINHPKLYKKFKSNPDSKEFSKHIQQGTGMIGIFKKGYTPIVLYKNNDEYLKDMNN